MRRLSDSSSRRRGRLISVAVVALAVLAATAQPVRGANTLTDKSGFTGPTYAESGALPPDPNGAVSATQIMVVVNSRFKVYPKVTNPDPTLDTTDAAFFSTVSGGAATSTPHVRYDRLSQRWFVTEITLTSTSNRILIAVSSGPTIADTSSFKFYQFQHDLVGPTPNMDTGHFASDASLAVDVNALYIGVNEFDTLGGTKQNTTGYVINKTDLVGGTLTVTAFRGLAVGAGAGPWTPLGVDNDDPAASEGYFIGVDNASFKNASYNTFMIRRVSTPSGVPSISDNISLTIPVTYPPVPQSIMPPASPLDTLDGRLFSAMIKKNKLTGVSSLWTAHTRGSNYAEWYQVDNLQTSPTLMQSGLIVLTILHHPHWTWMPSIAANGQGVAVVAYDHVDWPETPGVTIQSPGSGVSSRLPLDPAGTMATFFAGSGGFNYDVESPVQRWGRYSLTLVDPTDDQTFWTFREYVNAPNSWGVYVREFQGPPPAAISSASRTIIPRGTAPIDLTITGTALSGAGFFDPGPGYLGRLAASVSGG